MNDIIKWFCVCLSIMIIVSCATSKWIPTSLLTPEESKTDPIKNEKIVIIYSTNWCYWCKVAKEFMTKNKIKFFVKDYDNPKEKKRLKDFADEIGYTERLDSVPILVIGRKILVGYNSEQILCEIGRKKCTIKLFTTWETPLRK